VTESKTRARMKVLAALVTFMFAALTTRLWFLQVLASEEFVDLADQNQVRLVPTDPLRGQILDRNGTVLVGNRPSTVVLVDKREMEGREEEVLLRLSELIGVPVSDFVDRLNSVKYLPYQPIPVAEDVDKRDIFYIVEHRDLFPGVTYDVDSVRSYPQGKLAAHVLGYVGEVSDKQLEEDPSFQGYRPGQVVGKGGIESTYESDLFGESGLRELLVNAQGVVLDPQFRQRLPVTGHNVVLSIDAQIQGLSERTLLQGIQMARNLQHEETGRYFEAPGGAVIVMNPKNGQVLALASNPSYDPRLFLGGLSTREALSLDLCPPARGLCPPPTHDNPLLDRATQGLYPAGSTFKPFIAAGALKQGFARMDGYYDCPSSWYAPVDPTKHLFHNWQPISRGAISLPEALVVSCDTVFYQLGYRYWLRYTRSAPTDSGAHREFMQEDLAKMGFGRTTGIDLPGEQAGLVPDFDYVKRVFAENKKIYGKFYGWLPGDAVNLSIGQGFLQVTPIQTAVGFSALANGGTLFEPHVALRVERADGRIVRQVGRQAVGRLPISKRQVLFLRNALRGVTERGTAAGAFSGFPLSEIPVAGKTGTADIIPQQPYSWFAAMAPADDPKYVVVAMVEQGGHGSTTAAPIVRRVLEGLFGLPVTGRLRAGSVQD
jgi:penicillin-binding protein 2